MAQVEKPLSWIRRQWKTGWTKIPMVMLCHSITTPMFIGLLIYKYITWDFVPPAQKYRMQYTVMRPDDPRVARINHESRIDTVGFLAPKLPAYHYSSSK